MKRIDDELIAQLYNEFQTPERVKAHCRGVTDCAVKIAEALNEHGHDLDIELIYGAGMVHDMARIYDDHEHEGARKLEELGFPEEAYIVSKHMRHTDYHPVASLDALDIIVISDRLVIEGDFAGVDARYDYIEAKAEKVGMLDDKMREHLRHDRQKLKDLIAGIEQEIGCKIEDLIKAEA